MASSSRLTLAAVAAIVAAAALSPTRASATTFTTTSPTGGALPSSVSAVGGIVVDLLGTSGARVISQVAASSEFVGQPSSLAYPLLFGAQTGFDSSVVNTLGGGIASAAFRITLFDGDNQAGDFDFNDNALLVNGIDFGNFSTVATQQTNGDGTSLISSGAGFGNETLDTGFFSSTDATTLGSLFNTLSSGKLEFRVADATPGDQFYDFTQGLDASVIDVGTGPVVSPPSGGGNGGGSGGGTAVPEPASLSLLGAAMLGVLASRKRRVHA